MIPLRTSVAIGRATPAVWTLMLANLVLFLIPATLDLRAYQHFIYEFALVPARYAYPDLARQAGLDPGNFLPLLTNAFLHAGWLHLGVNMWTLFLFGRPLEARIGSVAFTAAYMVFGIAASAGHFAFNLSSTIPALGASGAIAGVLGAFTIAFPREKVLMLFPIGFIPLIWSFPATVYAGLWFGFQILSGAGNLMQPEYGREIAWWAHIFGFLCGLWLARALNVGGRPPTGGRRRGRSRIPANGRRR